MERFNFFVKDLDSRNIEVSARSVVSDQAIVMAHFVANIQPSLSEIHHHQHDHQHEQQPAPGHHVSSMSPVPPNIGIVHHHHHKQQHQQQQHQQQQQQQQQQHQKHHPALVQPHEAETHHQPHPLSSESVSK
ncbi:hypothetical protein AAG570_004033 [Ranatra chinensis]|uniref:Uncharacterized protein n=1 Tax=Ranatra chinensis TaxID=642074 RepID=A0ABD0YH53_9HEMI